jgi:hypothetical protein
VNTDTGELYRLTEQFSGELERSQSNAAGPAELRALARMASTADEERAALAIARGERVVPISERAAQTVQLGHRERERRSRRRKAAKAARKGNRAA